MRRCRILIVLGLSFLIEGGLATAASAEDRPPTEAKQAREKFAKLLLPDGPQKRAAKAPDKHRRVVVNAFGNPHSPVNPGRPGNRP